jgi:cholesterol oxidase-like protein/FAD binding domain-containing protein
MVEAQRIRVENSAWVILSFAAKSDTFATPETDSLLISQSAVIDLATFPIPEGLVFTPDIKVSGDIRPSPPPPPPPITFKMNGRTANYSVHDYTYNWTVTYDSLGAPSGRPSVPGVFPANVPLNLLPYANWDQQIEAPAILTCAPQSASDAAAVCNWARQNGYQVRPRGVMHGWSPLTLPTTPIAGAKVLLVDLTKSLNQITFLPASGGLPNRVKVAAGALMLQLLQFLEAQPGGKGPAPGYSFPHTPAPGNLTVGGVLAIDAHGTAVRTPPNDNLPAGYGSMSNQVLAFTAVCTDPSSPNPDEYVARGFERGAADVKALLVNLGRTLVLDATLQVVDNYNLRCQSFTNLPWSTIFAPPTPAQPVPPNSFADFFDRTGRVETIWFPFSENPWLHVWTISPEKPEGSIAVSTPYNYPFADHVPDALQSFIKSILNGIPSVTPLFGQMAAQVTANGLDGKDAFGTPGVYPVSRDIWGPSKNSLLYIQDTTLRVTANGYAIHLKRSEVQQAVADFAAKYQAMLAEYASRDPKQYPINSAMEIRVTGLDDPAEVGISPAPASPVLSALGMDETDRQNGWDVAVWFDILTIPKTPNSDAFYKELEQWLVARFSGTAGRTMPEWSKGWAYTSEQGPWTDPGFLEHIRQTLTAGRDANDNWAYALTTLAKYDKFRLFWSPFLDQLFQPA